MIARISPGESFSFAAVSDAGVLGLAEARGAAPMPYKIEYMNGGDLVKTVDLPDDEWEEAIEFAQDGMVERRANFARILNDDGVEVWSKRNDTERA
jgi:hypothetical protein